jgi:formylglycine-generating enzyme required for sulfatase activity
VAVDSPSGASDDAMAHLGRMPQLERVSVSGEKVTDTGVKHLAGLRKLKTVCLSGTSVSDEGVRRFESLADLEQLYLTHTQVTDQGIRQLESMLPGCKVWRLEEQTNSVGMRFMLIPAGEFMMGSPGGDQDAKPREKPQHRVHITKPFYLGVHEVTQEQWEKLMGTRPWEGKSSVKEGADCAATCVSWKDAVAFCEKLSAKEGCTYRLPTEAEWEYACRASSITHSCFGGDPLALGNYAWYEGKAWSAGQRYAHSVGQKKPSGWGLYEMHGNVWEWCAGWYDSNYYANSPTVDPTGPSAGSRRVGRGGSWSSLAGVCRSALRFGSSPGTRGPILGFRVALVPSE